MSSYMFQLTVAEGQLGRLTELNEQYEPVMARVAAGIEGWNAANAAREASRPTTR